MQTPPFVAYRDPHSAVRRSRRDANFPALGRVLDGVLDQVAEYLAEPGAVAVCDGQLPDHECDDPDVLLCQRSGLDGFLDEPAEVDFLEAVAERPGLDP